MTYLIKKALVETGGGLGFTQTYAINDLYDPDVTAVGNQPIPFDQFCALYNTFRVVKTHVQLEAVNTTNTASSTGTFGITFTWNNALPATADGWFALPLTKTRELSTVGNHNYVRMEFDVLPWSVLQIPKRQYLADDDFLCSSTGSPAKRIYLNIWGVGTGAAFACQISGRITFSVQCQNPVMNALS